MRVLIVEDELAIRQQLATALKDKHFAVDTADDGSEAQYLISEHPYDLAIIDLGLPSLTGIELIHWLRQQQKTFPVLILTARSNWQDKVEGLEAGADDYVTKPCHPEEIIARVNALLRRSAGSATPVIKYGDLEIDSLARTVRLAGDYITLTSFEYNTLEYLVHNSDKVISKTELTEHLYDQDFDRDSNVIEVFIGRLRKKLDPDNQLQPITTIRGQGYRFTPEQLIASSNDGQPAS